MDDYLIRPIEARDIERAIGIITINDEDDLQEATEFFRVYCTEDQAEERGTHFVVESEERELVATGGWVQALDDEKTCWIGHLFVDPYYQGQGIGSMLLSYVLNDIQERAKVRVLVAVEEEDIVEGRVRFYEVHGFRQTDIKANPPVLPPKEAFRIYEKTF